MSTIDQPLEGFGGTPGLATLMRKENTTIAIMALDASGSMKGHNQAPAHAVDAVVGELRTARDGRHYYVGVTSFAARATVLQRVMPVSEISPIRGYIANGPTRLYGTVYDLLALLINEARALAEPMAKDLRVILGVFSDGDDNASPSYHGVLRQTSQIARDLGWQLQAYGIGIDAAALANLLGFNPDQSLSVEGSIAGISSATGTFLNHTLAPGGTSGMSAVRGDGTDNLDPMQSMQTLRPDQLRKLMRPPVRPDVVRPEDEKTLPPGYAK